MSGVLRVVIDAFVATGDSMLDGRLCIAARKKLLSVLMLRELEGSRDGLRVDRLGLAQFLRQ
jgi:hypothetical protein